jgi:S-adenosylmethionine:tRNA ribosyltransferase-isomerase
MVLNRSDGLIEHRRFYNVVDYLRSGDVLVFNDSRVIPARLSGRRVDSGGRVEILLLRRLDDNVWEALVNPGKRLRLGARVEITKSSIAGKPHEVKVLAEVIELRKDGIKGVKFSDETLLPWLGEIPLPPYIRVPLAHPGRYQTVYAEVAGSVAAPTAGLHFTTELLAKIERKGVHCLFVTLHIGLDTFRPVREDDPLAHPIYKEYGVINETVASQLSQAKKEGRRIVCVGTTTVRIVEQAAQLSNPLSSFAGWVSLFISPGYQFRMVDTLVTNFHLPRSTLLMLVTAFAGKEFTSQAYQEAIASGYRFYSFGDAMLII